MWRCETLKRNFPNKGWSKPVLALRADIFEASHTYRLRGLDKYLTIVEAQGNRRRYYKAYLADRLEGPWKPLADTIIEKPFAGYANVRQAPERTTNISHGQLIRCGIYENLEVDPSDVRFLQGLRLSSLRWRFHGGTGFPACATRGGTPRLQRARRVVPLQPLIPPTYWVPVGGTGFPACATRSGTPRLHPGHQ